MYDLNNFGLKEMIVYPSYLRQPSANVESMKEVANNVVQFLYDNHHKWSDRRKSLHIGTLFKNS